MPKFSLIPNKTTTCISIDKNKLEKIREKGLNLSQFIDEALTRELNPNAEKHFNKAISNQAEIYKNYVQTTHQEKNFDDFKYGGTQNVLEEEEHKSKVRKSERDIEGF